MGAKMASQNVSKKRKFVADGVFNAKSMKFSDGYMIKAGNPCRNFIDSAVRHVLLRQGVLGIKVNIMLPYDPTGKSGPKTPMPDKVDILEPPKDDVIVQPSKDVAPVAGM